MQKQYFLILTFLFILFLPSCNTKKEEKTTKYGTVSDSAMVVSAHPLASQVGVEILKKGGNAVDAAISVQFALSVTLPAAGNIGGGGFMVIRTAEGNTASLDYREAAPTGSSKNMYLDEQGDPIDDLSKIGHLASGVPGTVAGMQAAWEKYGSLPWEDLLTPAIKLANEGFALTSKEANGLNRIKDQLIKYNTQEQDFLIHNWKEGDLIYWKDLGATLERIRDNKRDGFYTGKTAQDIVQEMERGGGIITYEDLINYQAKWRVPITNWYKEYKIISMPPPSSGGVALVQLLKMTADYPINKWGWDSEKTIHLMTEAERRVYADRAYWLGDPDYWKVPLKELMDPNYLVDKMADFNPNKATPSDSIAEGKIEYYESMGNYPLFGGR